ncbi:hypothetical protein X551_04069 [Methylibium sp. T29]|nr:hypothetical protein X551_04069 [Methylibium sp. T29]EWS57927.1 hypothetical protein Y694_04155 [Methylibium sp. T29-B]
MIDGMIRLATVTWNSASAPARRLRKASPALSASSTVSTITTAPSASERRSAAPMSTTPRPFHSSWYQCSDNPRIGSVSPPSGPWKLSTKIVITGP